MFIQSYRQNKKRAPTEAGLRLNTFLGIDLKGM
jgi:hypothetical protein